MKRPTVLVDGYNVLLALARREGLAPDDVDFPRARRDLTLLLGEWGAARGRDVVIAWDGRSKSPRQPGAGPSGLRAVFLEPPAEADDWIVEEALRLAQDGRPTQVATRDRALLSRLPPTVRVLLLEELAVDLDALAQAPLSAPQLGGPSDEAPAPASIAPVDTRRLPRRRTSLPPPPAKDDSKATPRSDGSDGPAARARADAAARKERRRQRYQRAKTRRGKSGP